jgi:predicted metal-dependent hydrolase
MWGRVVMLVVSRSLPLITNALVNSKTFQRVVHEGNNALLRQLEKMRNPAKYRQMMNERELEKIVKMERELKNRQSNSANTPPQQPPPQQTHATSTQTPREAQEAAKRRTEELYAAHAPSRYSGLGRWYATNKYEFMVWWRSRFGGK